MFQFLYENSYALNQQSSYLFVASLADTQQCRPPAGVTDSQGLVRFEDLYWVTVDVKVDDQQLADEMEQRPPGLSRNPNSQPISNNIFRPETRDPRWRSKVQISAEQHGYVHHYVTIGELCDRMPGIEGWTDKEPPVFHFPPKTSLKGTVISREALEKRHVIEICPFRAWSLVLHDTKEYSLANGYNPGVMADMAYADNAMVEDFFNRKCLDLSCTP